MSDAQFYSGKRVVIYDFSTPIVIVEIICGFYLRLTIYFFIVIYLLFLNCTIRIFTILLCDALYLLVGWTHEMVV